MTDDVAERLRLRYPRSRLPRPVLAGLVGLLALTGLSWLVWSAWVHSRPPVTADVTAYVVQSDTSIAVTLTVDRPDPSLAARCRVIAQATDFTPVAEQEVAVPPAAYRVVDVRLTLTTLRRATSASVRECET
ncbi:MAG: DUF4307 domain-containing protein [Actinomycetes bacterium]